LVRERPLAPPSPRVERGPLRVLAAAGLSAPCRPPATPRGRCFVLLASAALAISLAGCVSGGRSSLGVTTTATGAGAGVAGPDQTNGSTPTGVALPDPSLTPGAAIPGVTTAQVCTPGYAAGVRHVTTATRRQVFALYVLPYPPPAGVYEVDHLISLELGGSNDVTNLWPEPYTGDFGAHVKDRFENYLHAEVCAGTLTLETAQHEIASNWYQSWIDAGSP
jgi:hypothetical protein